MRHVQKDSSAVGRQARSGCAGTARRRADEAGACYEPYQKLGPPPASLQVTHTVARVSDKALCVVSGGNGVGSGPRQRRLSGTRAGERAVAAQLAAPGFLGPGHGGGGSCGGTGGVGGACATRADGARVDRSAGAVQSARWAVAAVGSPNQAPDGAAQIRGTLRKLSTVLPQEVWPVVFFTA